MARMGRESGGPSVSECKHEWHQPHLEPVFCKKCLLDKEVWLESELAEARREKDGFRTTCGRMATRMAVMRAALRDAIETLELEGCNVTADELRAALKGEE
jgi:hypothetical protein